MHHFLRTIILLLAFSAANAQAESLKTLSAPKGPPTWAVYYDSKVHPQHFLKYPVLLMDLDRHPSLESLVNDTRVILGYISAGEAENYRSDFADIQKRGFLLKENKAWKGHYIVDIRKPEWTKYIIEEKIPMVIHKHFNGIMLDTLDSVIELEAADPKQYAGMKTAAVDLVRAIHMHYPNLKIMVNRGFDILPDIAPDIDYILAESIFTTYDEKTKKYVYVPSATYKGLADMLKSQQAKTPNLKVMTLDYWNPKETSVVKAIYAAQRANGFVPYVSTMDLQSLHPEP